jgi:hypothetical protein
MELYYTKLYQLLPIIDLFSKSLFRCAKSSKSTANTASTKAYRDNVSQMIHEWILQNQSYSCQFSSEVNYLKQMMKLCVNGGQPVASSDSGKDKSDSALPSGGAARVNEDWHSYDGREIPVLPNYKQFQLSSFSKFKVVETSASSELAKESEKSQKTGPEGLSLEPIKLDFFEDLNQPSTSSADAGNKSSDRAKGLHKEKREVNEFSMVVYSDGSNLRMISEVLEIS